MTKLSPSAKTALQTIADFPGEVTTLRGPRTANGVTYFDHPDYPASLRVINGTTEYSLLTKGLATKTGDLKILSLTDAGRAALGL